MKEKGRFLKKYRGNQCLNCNVPLDTIDKYCHHCGQINTTKKLAFSDFFEEFFASLFSYDSRLRLTILALLFNPGKISKEYVTGKRIKYANPFRFYLSVSIIFFIINGFFLDFDKYNTQIEKNNKVENRALKTPKKNKNTGNEKLTNTTLDTNKTNHPEHIYYNEDQLSKMGILEGTYNRWKTYKSHYTKTKEVSANTALENLSHKKNGYTKYMYNRTVKTEKMNRNPIELLKFIFNNLPFIIFFFLPFLALAIWLIYMKRPHTYMEHLVFTFHTQTMFFILMGIAILIDQMADIEITSKIATMIFLFYLYKAMRKFYMQSRGKTIVKFLLVNTLFFILATIGTFFSFLGSIFIF